MNLISTPLFHIGAFATLITQTITGGRIVFSTGRFDPEQVLALIAAERAALGPFRRWRPGCSEHPAFDSYDLSSCAPSRWRCAGAAGPAGAAGRRIPATRAAAWSTCGDDRGRRILHRRNRCRPATLPEDRRPGATHRRTENRRRRRRRQGEIVVRSPHRDAGVRRESTTAQSIRTAGCAPGTSVTSTTRATCSSTAAASDMVIRGGENIACPHVEAALMRHPDVVEAAAIGLPHPDLGEELAAAVVVPGRRPGTDRGGTGGPHACGGGVLRGADPVVDPRRAASHRRHGEGRQEASGNGIHDRVTRAADASTSQASVAVLAPSRAWAAIPNAVGPFLSAARRRAPARGGFRRR